MHLVLVLNVEPQVLVVGHDASSIAEAVALAGEGDTIELPPGRYVEAVTVTGDVHIVAPEGGVEWRTRHEGERALTVTGNASVTGVDFVDRGGVHVEGGALAIVDTDFAALSGTDGGAIRVDGGGRIDVMDSRFWGNAATRGADIFAQSALVHVEGGLSCYAAAGEGAAIWAEDSLVSTVGYAVSGAQVERGAAVEALGSGELAMRDVSLVGIEGDGVLATKATIWNGLFAGVRGAGWSANADVEFTLDLDTAKEAGFVDAEVCSAEALALRADSVAVDSGHPDIRDADDSRSDVGAYDGPARRTLWANR